MQTRPSESSWRWLILGLSFHVLAAAVLFAHVLRPEDAAASARAAGPVADAEPSVRDDCCAPTRAPSVDE